jgi:hypothetical protein
MPAEKKRLAISFAPEDQAFASQLQEQLPNYGLTLKSIAQPTDTDGLLLIMTPASKGSSKVEGEWKAALAAGKTIIPVALKAVQDGFHPEIDALKAIDLSDASENFLYKFRRILEGLKAQGFGVTENLTEGLYQMKAAPTNTPAIGNRARWPLIIGGIVILAAIIAFLLSRPGAGTPAATSTPVPAVEVTADVTPEATEAATPAS